MKQILLSLILVHLVWSVFSQELIDLTKVDPYEYYEKTAVDKYDWDDPAASHLVLESLKGAITQNELNGLKNYLIEYRLPTHNFINYYFRKRINSYMMEWVYHRTSDIKLLNKAIQVAEKAIEYRNDNFGKHHISYDRSVAPVWPNFKDTEEYSDGTVGLVPGAGAFAGLPVITVPVRMIAQHPDLWELTYEGKSYKNIALGLIEEAFKTIDYTYEVFVGNDNLFRYPMDMLREDWQGRVVIYNRIFPMISGTFPLIDALEKFDMQKQKRDKMEQVNLAKLEYLTNDMTFYGTETTPYLKYPYSQASSEKNPGKMEDFTHGSLDSRDFQHFFNYGEYGFDTRYVKAMANTLADIVAQGDGTFSDFIDGKGKIEEYTSPISYDGYIWYARYRPELYDLIIQHIIDSGIAYKKGVWDAFCLFEILKLKEDIVLKTDNRELNMPKKKVWVSNNNIYFNWGRVGKVKIFDLYGRCLEQNSEVENSLSVSHFKPGIYIVKTYGLTKKIVLL